MDSGSSVAFCLKLGSSEDSSTSNIDIGYGDNTSEIFV